MSAIHETKQHGKQSFPYTVYGGRLPEWLSGFPLHWHDEMEIIRVTKGSMIVGIQNKDYILNEGDIALIQPQLIHCIKQDGNRKAHYFNILFRLSLLYGNNDVCADNYLHPIYTGEFIIPKHLPINDALNISISPYIRRLAEITLSGKDRQELMIKSCLFAVMHYLSSSVEPESQKDQQQRNLYDKLKKSLDYIREHYAEEITVERAASISNFSASHFSKMFRQLTGSPFNKYLINYRLETAAKKLTEENAAVSEIAFACGFNNLSYFTRAFRNKYGMTPHHYKNKTPPG